MSNSVIIVENELTPQGMVRIHLLDGNKKSLDEAKAAWKRQVPWESAEQICSLEYIEAGVWHYLLMWPARGMVVPVFADHERTGQANAIILWILQKGERVSEAVESAAWRYLAWFGEWPDTAWVGRKMEKFARRTVRVLDHEIHLAAAEWMADDGVGVGVEWMKEEKSA